MRGTPLFLFMKRAIIVSIFIIIFRLLDLYTTKLCIINFQEEEQNLLVKFFHLDMQTFFILEIILALLLAICYLFYYKNKEEFNFSRKTFLDYFHFFLFKKNNPKILDWLFKINIKRVLILLGSVIPVFIITTSTIFSLNNIWVYYYNKGNNNAILYYEMLWKFHFFDFVIFVFPPLFLLFLLYKKLHNSYVLNK